MQITAKILAFYILLGSFLPRTEYSQLQKLPNLYQHYQHHVEEAELAGNTISIKEFLWLHFVVPDEHKHNDNSHESLPFHSFDFGVNLLLLSFSLPVFEPAEVFSPIVPLPKKSVSFGIIASLFRPPITT